MGASGVSRLVGVMLLAHPVPATSPAGPPGVLQVPYVAQSELLCGGAAIAMLERWWGRRGVYAGEFLPLVRPAEGGIRTTDMVSATRSRGWLTQEVRGTPALVMEALSDSVPVIALIQVAPNRYHYVVIVGWNAERVTFHDPAVRPYATLATKTFLDRWNHADAWALLVRPATVASVSPPAAEPIPAIVNDSLPCRPWLDEAVDAAIANHLDDAVRLLTSAGVACPAEPLVLRELAGVRFRQGRHLEAIRLATEYLQRVPSDSLGWQLLATSRYLAGESADALAAWNAVGKPTVDLVQIDGIRRTRFRTIADAVGIAPGELLTPERFRLAERRVPDIPAITSATVSYAVVPGRMVELHANVVEQPVLGSLPRFVVESAVGVVFRHQVNLSIVSLLGAGERWTAQWRWESADPRKMLRLEIPARIGLPGTVTLEESWSQYHFSDAATTPNAPHEEQRAASLGFEGWLSSRAEALVGARVERWATEGDFLALSVGGALHGLHDRVALIALGEAAVSPNGSGRYARLQLRAAWTSPVRPSAFRWTARLGSDWVSANAPPGLRPIAGGGPGRDIPLRAQPYITDGFLPASRTGTLILHGGVETERPLTTIGPLSVAAAFFLDGADVGTAVAATMRHERFLDGGAGLRLGLMEKSPAVLRIDLARGLLTDHRWGLSVGLQQPWPPRLHPFH